MAMTWEQRKTLRQEARKNRSFLSREEVRRNSELIINSLRRLNTLNNARVVMGYLAIEKEVDIWPYLEFCLEQGQIVVLPRVEKTDDRLVAVKYIGPDNMRIGAFGIREPLGEPFDPVLIDAVIVPGVAFDRRGYRLGYGKGYYDRFLPLLSSHAFICGVAHSLQVVDDVMPHSKDFHIPCLVTEREIRKIP